MPGKIVRTQNAPMEGWLNPDVATSSLPSTGQWEVKSVAS